MIAITIFVLIGLALWCGVLTRRIGAGDGCACVGSGGEAADARDRRLTDLAEAYHHLAQETEERIAELEERLDFAERALIQGRERAGIRD